MLSTTRLSLSALMHRAGDPARSFLREECATSDSPSRRDVFRGLFAAGLAWLGLGKLVKSAPAVPVTPVVRPPIGELPSRLATIHGDGIGTVTTMVYDGCSRLTMETGHVTVTTFTLDQVMPRQRWEDKRPRSGPEAG
jgi:hypothetical protein